MVIIMALDGITVAGLASELRTSLSDGRITKIAQPEKDELLLTIKQSLKDSDGKTVRTGYRLIISVNPSLPLMYITDDNKPSPMTAPTFCMVLRKHLNNCQITDISQVGLERVIRIKLKHLNEMGDVCTKYLIVELMGKHSNIIFTDENDVIIDSIKHISALISSVREVLPGRNYFIPNTQDKKNPFTLTENEFCNEVLDRPVPLQKAIYTSITGFSPVMAAELLNRASLSEKNSPKELSEMEKIHLYRNFHEMMQDVGNENFSPCIVFENDVPVEFAALPLTSYNNGKRYNIKTLPSISVMLRQYYSAKDTITRIRQKSTDLRRITTTLLERARKKYDLQEKQLKDTSKRDKYKVYGELLTTYGYSLKGGEKSITCDNYYTGEKITIPLDDTKNAMDNAKRYFDKYAKLKRTYEALTVQTKETFEEISHLESISNSLDIARKEADLADIKRELSEYGYINKRGKNGRESKRQEKSKPLHYISSDGFHIYIGKNNYQNDELTFKLATGNDWWFHSKSAAGSHVIVKTEGKELPDRTFEEAARLAAYYSKAREQGKAEIDYIQKKHVKKPNGSKPGFVVYYTNYSMTIDTDITGIKEVTDG